MGGPASLGLEKLAEGGDSSAFIAEAAANSAVITSSTTTSGPFAAGSSQSVSLTGKHASDLSISVATMLANTNDAFTGANSIAIGQLQVGESLSINSRAYDAGTEVNSESLGTIPGPADNGEGFNSSRAGDVDRIAIHSGTVTPDDGLVTSILNETHRFNGPASHTLITRTK